SYMSQLAASTKASTAWLGLAVADVEAPAAPMVAADAQFVSAPTRTANSNNEPAERLCVEGTITPPLIRWIDVVVDVMKVVRLPCTRGGRDLTIDHAVRLVVPMLKTNRMTGFVTRRLAAIGLVVIADIDLDLVQDYLTRPADVSWIWIRRGYASPRASRLFEDDVALIPLDVDACGAGSVVLG
ncbi:MAG TPA: hypothetical protein VF235_00550, partial [Actinomycetota bacterium]